MDFRAHRIRTDDAADEEANRPRTGEEFLAYFAREPSEAEGSSHEDHSAERTSEMEVRGLEPPTS